MRGKEGGTEKGREGGQEFRGELRAVCNLGKMDEQAASQLSAVCGMRHVNEWLGLSLQSVRPLRSGALSPPMTEGLTTRCAMWWPLISLAGASSCTPRETQSRRVFRCLPPSLPSLPCLILPTPYPAGCCAQWFSPMMLVWIKCCSYAISSM